MVKTNLIAPVITIGLVLACSVIPTKSYAEQLTSSLEEFKEKPVMIDKNLVIYKTSDNRIVGIKKVNSLKPNQLNKILIMMGFNEQEISTMSTNLKKNIVSDGGRKVTTKTQAVSLNLYNKNTNQHKIFKADNFANLEKNINNHFKSVSALSAGSTDNGWDKNVSNWHGKTYAIYQGKTTGGAELRYNVYNVYHWDSPPFAQKQDSVGIWWSTKAEKWASAHNEWFYITGDQGGIYDLKYTYDNSQIYGSAWKFDWYTPYYIVKADGFGKQEIRVPKASANTTLNIQGGYFHQYYFADGSINIGVAGINFTSSHGDQWKWTESFTMND